MYPPTLRTQNRTNRNLPSTGMALLFAGLPLALLFAATFPGATAGLVVGVAAGTTLQR